MIPLSNQNVLSNNWKNIKHYLKTLVLMDGHEHSYRWQQLPCDTDKSFPAQRSKHAICISNGALYVYGGRDKSIVHRDLWKYQLDTGQWERLMCRGDNPRLLQEHSLISYKNKLYIFGGQFAAGTESETPLWILDLETVTWRKHRPESDVMTPAGRRGHSVVTNGDQMVIYGGYIDMRGSASELWLFDMEEEMWHLAYSILNEGGPVGRHGHSAVVHANSMWVVGGMCDLTALSDMWKWDFSVRKWSRVRCKNNPPEVHGHSACVLRGDMIIVGGESQWALQDSVWQFNFRSQTWQKLKFEGEPSPRSYHACIAVPSFLLTPTTDQTISQSEPSLRLNELMPFNRNTIRPNTSPGYPSTHQDSKMPDAAEVRRQVAHEPQSRFWSASGMLSGHDTGKHLFKNKINPNEGGGRFYGGMLKTIVLGTSEIGGGIATGAYTQIAEGDGANDTGANLKVASDLTLTEGDKAQEGASAENGDNAQQTWFDEVKTSTSNVSLSEQVGSDTDFLPLMTEMLAPVIRTTSGGFDNPLFSRELSTDSTELPSPNKRLRQSADVPDAPSARCVSTEALQSLSNTSNANSPRQHLPGVVKSGSLDSLLQGIGGVNITYIQIDNEPPAADNAILENIEDRDLTELEQSHNIVRNSHRFRDFTGGQFESSQDRLLSSSSDIIELSDFNTSQTQTITDVANSDDLESVQTLTSDFMLMNDDTDARRETFERVELAFLDADVIPHNRDTERLFSNRPSHNYSPSILRESVADINDHPVGMTMILCGGKEGNRSTLEVQPMPMWRLDFVKT